jgi:ADP-ribose pyrophosphatase YjhB (NUDIX family)
MAPRSAAYPADIHAPNRPSDRLLRAIYRLAYRLDRARNFLLRPRTSGAYVAVWLHDRLLLIRNSYKAGYTMPCGHIGRGERPADAASRELREEVGLRVAAAELTPVFETWNHSEYKRDHVHVFALRLERAPAIELDGREVVWAGFRSAEQALAMPLHTPVEAYLRACSSARTATTTLALDSACNPQAG